MEGVSANVYKGLRGYWRRRGYKRLHNRKSRAADEVAPAETTKRRRFWRIRKLKIKLRKFSPKKFLLGLRDAYVNMMNRVANTRVVGSGGYGGGYAIDGVSGFGLRPIKEYDEKMIVEIYKSIMMAQGNNVVPRDAAWIGSELVTCRGR